MMQWLSGLSSIWVKGIATAFFLLMIIWAILLPKEYIFKGAPDKKLWRDLRLWAVIVLVVQIIIYIKF
ncbi:MAG: hypothetical protein PHE49_10105 [bacterium]|nr:hypothetical protein [bacterium]